MPSNYYRSDGWVKTVQGPAVPGAQVYVCFQPANTSPPATPPRTTPTPWQGPNPQAPIFSDAGLTPITQPVITDGFGHYDFYALPGLYTVVILFGGTVQEVLVDQSIGNVGTSGGGALELDTNGSPNFNQNRLNIQQGPGITLFSQNDGTTIISSSGSGGPVLETNGTPNGSQSLLNLVNGKDIGVSQDGSGNVTIASTASDSLPQPNTARFSMWEVNWGATNPAAPWLVINDSLFASVGGGGGATTATYVEPTTTSGPAIQLSTGFDVVIVQSGGKVFYPTRRTTFKSTLKTFVDINAAAVQLYQGLSNVSANINAFPMTGDCAVVGVAKSENVVFGNLLFICAVGGVSTTMDTGVPASDPTGTVGIRYSIKIVVESGSAQLFVNGSLAATCSTNVPTSNGLSPYTYIGNFPNTTNTGTSSMVVEYVYAETLTP